MIFRGAQKQEAHLKAEITKLLALAEAADNQGTPDGMDIPDEPDEIARGEDLLDAIAIAKVKIEDRSAHNSILTLSKLSLRIKLPSEKKRPRKRGRNHAANRL